MVTQEVSVTSLAKFYEETVSLSRCLWILDFPAHGEHQLRLTPNLVEEAYCDSQNRSGIIVRLSTRRLDEVYLDQGETADILVVQC